MALCIGSASAGFLLSLDWVTNYRETHLWLLALLPIAGAAVGLLYSYAGNDIEQGIGLLIYAIRNPEKTIPFSMAPFVYTGTIITHLFGGSAGREGTALQMAAAISDRLSKPFRLKKIERQIVIVAAIAGGFGSVFGTPVAGAVFSLEVFLTGRLRYRAMLPAFTVSILSDMVTTLWNVHHTHYHISFIPDISFINIIYMIVAGIVFGLCGSFFSKAIHFLVSVFKSAISFPPLRTFTGGIIIALAVFTIGTTKYIGLGIPTIVLSFNQQLPAYDFAIKMAFTIITLTAGFKGGEVTPLFFIGAALGNALALVIPLPAGLLAGMGFVAVFSGATNSVLASSIMAMELFGIECGVYAGIACVLAYLVSGPHSIYVRHIPTNSGNTVSAKGSGKIRDL